MRNIILAGVAFIFSYGVAHADVIDDNLAKAQKSVITAQARLVKAQACADDRETCLKDMTTKAQKSADRAAKKLAALMADSTPAGE